MNKTYHTLSEKFADESRSELSFDYVKSTIANTIKVRYIKHKIYKTNTYCGIVSN